MTSSFPGKCKAKLFELDRPERDTKCMRPPLRMRAAAEGGLVSKFTILTLFARAPSLNLAP